MGHQRRLVALPEASATSTLLLVPSTLSWSGGTPQASALSRKACRRIWGATATPACGGSTYTSLAQPRTHILCTDGYGSASSAVHGTVDASERSTTSHLALAGGLTLSACVPGGCPGMHPPPSTSRCLRHKPSDKTVITSKRCLDQAQARELHRGPLGGIPPPPQERAGAVSVKFWD